MNATASIRAIAAAVVLAPLSAQGQPTPTHPKQQRLENALETMVALPSLAFETTEERDLAVMREVAGKVGAGKLPPGIIFGSPWQQPSADKVSGVWTRDVLYGAKDEHHLLAAAGRTIARRGEQGPWLLRHQRVADGRAAPRVVNPQALLLALADADLRVIHSEVGTRDDRPVEMITVTLSRDDWAELVWAGCLPENEGNQLFMHGAEPPKPDGDLDLCFVLDPATGIIHEILATSYVGTGLGRMGGFPMMAAAALPVPLFAVGEDEAVQEVVEEADPELKPAAKDRPAKPASGEENPPKAEKVAAVGPALITLRIQGGAVVPDQESEDDEHEANGEPLKFFNGMPVRSKSERDVVHFTIRFSEHGTAELPSLDSRAKRLLGR